MIAHKKVNVIVDRALKVNAKVSEKIMGTETYTPKFYRNLYMLAKPPL